MKRRNVRTLSLIVVTFTYLLIGAAVFDALEGPNNDRTYEALTKTRSDFISKYNMTDDDYKLLELLVLEKKPHKSGPQWKFAGSFYYALAVLALIGYGHSTPATALGKAFTMGYAIAGIPMAMVMFQSMGERMNKAYSMIIKKCRTSWGSTRTDANEFDLIIASGITSSIVILCGAIMYHTQEGWAFFDSVYYSFITLSTIGFGDFVALQQGQTLQFRPGYVVCSFIFLLLGLAALASSINLLVLRCMTLSLEEEEQEEELQDVSQNVVTLDGEVMAVNGRVLAGHSIDTSNHNLYSSASSENVSVCSCTCYGESSNWKTRRFKKSSRRTRRGNESYLMSMRRKRKCNEWWNPLIALGCVQREEEDDGNYYDEETQSINNYTRFAVKRSSF
ncbi:two pore potassium channel protein sup-9 [Lepeophtheirus salmonis]|uniref:two pore potassium channel protein sup-9 n=1 Tax=Lepeophtheirus salmonis TaxID=72036 RepID=UPI001AE19358|nr:two pore potassium channel protein sup-9-like [Lepeophtheirus salmonis]